MSRTPQILAFSGSARSGSFNSKLAMCAANAATAAGAVVTLVDWRDMPLPLYDQDLEKAEGLPGHVLTFKALLKRHDGLLIVSPEYNSSITPLLKNCIDWASRPAENEVPLECFRDKVAALFSASPGALGGLRGLTHVRQILGNINVLVLPEQLAISRAHDAFDDDGQLKLPEQQAKLERIVHRLVDMLGRLERSAPES